MACSARPHRFGLGDDEGAVVFPEQRDVAGLGDVFEGVAAYTGQEQYNASIAAR